MAPPAAKGKDSKEGKDGKDKKAPVTARPDPFVGSRTVAGLNTHNFEEYLADKDAALVMFYDPEDPQCEWSKKHFLKAAKTVVRENSAFAAVDCTKEGDLCEGEGAITQPFFKLYSKGKLVGNYNDPQKFIYHTMIQFVQNCPILTDPERPPRPC